MPDVGPERRASCLPDLRCRLCNGLNRRSGPPHEGIHELHELRSHQRLCAGRQGRPHPSAGGGGQGLQALDDRGRRASLYAGEEVQPRSLRADRAQPAVFEGPYPAADEARRLRPEWQAQPAEPRQIGLRAHQLGCRARPGGRRDQARAGHLWPLGAHGHDLLAPLLGTGRLQDQRLPALLRPYWLHHRNGQPGQLGRLALGRNAHLRLLLAPRHARALRHAGGWPQERGDDRLLVQ